MLSKNESMICRVELSGHPNRHYLQMRLRCLWLLLACLVTSIATSAPAVWAPHELIVNLHDLPKHYSCDDLWYKFRAILLTLGWCRCRRLPVVISVNNRAASTAIGR